MISSMKIKRKRNRMMKKTVNIPQTYLALIDKLCGENKPFPSRNDMVRVAVHEYLKKLFSPESEQENGICSHNQLQPLFTDSNEFVRVPDGFDEHGVPKFHIFKKITKTSDHNHGSC